MGACRPRSLADDPVSTPLVRGQIVEVDLDPVVGHEQGCMRPCIVVQNNAGNRFSSTTIVVPLTSTARIGVPSPIYVTIPKGDGGLKKESIALTDQIHTVDFKRIGRFFGTLSVETMQKVDWALMVSLGLARGRKP